MRQFRSLFLSCFTLLFLQGALLAQTPTITWGQPVEKNNVVLKIIGETEAGVYALSERKGRYYLEQYAGSGMTMALSKELEFPEIAGQQTELEEIYYVGGQLLLFTVAYDRSDKNYLIYGTRLDEKGNAISKPIEIMNAEVEKKARKGEFGFELSRDRSKILVYHSAPYKRKEKSWYITMKVITPDLETIKEISEVIPLKEDDDRVEASSYLVDDRAAVYFAVRQVGYVEGAQQTRSLDIYRYDPSNGFNLEVIPIDFGTFRASSLILNTDPEGNLVGGGFYGEEATRILTRYEGIAGTYFIRLKRGETEPSFKKMSPFGEEFAATILKERKAAKGRMVPNLFIPRELLPLGNGGAVMTAEFYQVTVTQNRNSRTITIQHGPIVVANITPQGEVDWVRSIPKNQLYTRSEAGMFGLAGPGVYFGNSYWASVAKDQTVYHSYVLGISNESLHFVFNDNPKNEQIEHFRDTKALTGYKRSVPVAVTIDVEGNMTKEILLEKDRSEVVLRPGVSYQQGYDHVVIYGTRRKDEKFGVIEF